MKFKIINLMQQFDLKGQSGSLQYWELRQVRNERVLTAAGQPFLSTKDHKGLENYRERSLKQKFSIGPGRRVDEEWFACIAAQTRVADQRTSHDSNQSMGQLVVPVFVNMGADQILLGVLELVTTLPKACYIEDFYQIYNLLKHENLETNPMVKTIKVIYADDIIKFLLPLTSGITYLWGQVTKRLKEVNQTAFQIEYKDCNGKVIPIKSDADLRACIGSSSYVGEKMMKMSIKQVALY